MPRTETTFRFENFVCESYVGNSFQHILEIPRHHSKIENPFPVVSFECTLVPKQKLNIKLILSSMCHIDYLNLHNKKVDRFGMFCNIDDSLEWLFSSLYSVSALKLNRYGMS